MAENDATQAPINIKVAVSQAVTAAANTNSNSNTNPNPNPKNPTNPTPGVDPRRERRHGVMRPRRLLPFKTYSHYRKTSPAMSK